MPSGAKRNLDTSDHATSYATPGGTKVKSQFQDDTLGCTKPQKAKQTIQWDVDYLVTNTRMPSGANPSRPCGDTV